MGTSLEPLRVRFLDRSTSVITLCRRHSSGLLTALVEQLAQS